MGSAVFRYRDKLRFIVLEIRAMTQYGSGMVGALSIKKRFRQTPLSSFDVTWPSSFFKKILYNIVKYIIFIKKMIVNLSRI